ncbi:MFS transporter [Clostridium sp. Marseille-QA1073]
MITIGYIEYISFTYIGGLLCEKISQKKVFLLELGICTITLFLFSQISSYIMLLICMFLLNVGIGLLSISINTLSPIVAMSFQAIIMNATHFCYELGSAVGQYTTDNLLENGVNCRSIYLVIAILFAIAFIVFIFVKRPQAHIKKGNNKVNLLRIFKNKMVYFYILTLGFYCFPESGTSNSLVNFI